MHAPHTRPHTCTLTSSSAHAPALNAAAQPSRTWLPHRLSACSGSRRAHQRRARGIAEAVADDAQRPQAPQRADVARDEIRAGVGQAAAGVLVGN